MGLVYSNASADDFYAECWNCATVLQGLYRAQVAWLPVNSTASIDNIKFMNIFDNSSSNGNSTEEEDNSGNGDELVVIIDNTTNNATDSTFLNNNNQLQDDFDRLFPSGDNSSSNNDTGSADNSTDNGSGQVQ